MTEPFFSCEAIVNNSIKEIKKGSYNCSFYDDKILIFNASSNNSISVEDYSDVALSRNTVKKLFSKKYAISFSCKSTNKIFLELLFKKEADADLCGKKVYEKIDEESEIKRKNVIYDDAVALKNKDKKESLLKAIDLFSSIADWKDSNELLKKAKVRIIEIDNNSTYNQAGELIVKAKKSSDKKLFASAIDLLKTIVDWRDSKDKIAECEESIRVIVEKENAQKQASYEKAIECAKEGTIKTFEKAIKLLPVDWKDANSLKQKYQKRIEEIKVEEENAKKQKSYEAAVTEAQKDTISSYEKAVRVLSSIQDWKDSKQLIEKYNKRTEEIKVKEEEDRKNQIYNDAVKISSGKTVKDQERAIKLFSDIVDWKDSKAQIENCKKTIKHIEEQAFYDKIDKVIDNCKNAVDDKKKHETVIKNHSKNIYDFILNNPYYILGVSSTSEQNKLLDVKDKIEKFARLKLAGGYKSSFDLKNLQTPSRDISNIQSAIVAAKDISSKWLWFETDKYSVWWDNDEIFTLFDKEKDDNEYDLLLACYINRIFCDPDFTDSAKWNAVLTQIDKICKLSKEKLFDILKTHSGCSDEKRKEELITSFKENIIKPITVLLENATKVQIDNFAKINVPKSMDESLCTSVVMNVTNACYPLDIFVKEIENDKSKTDIDKLLTLINTVESSVYKNIDSLIRIVGKDSTYAKRIKKKYKDAIWNSTNILNSNNKKTKSIPFIKEIYDYCDDNDKRRLRNTYGYDKLGVSEKDLQPDEMNTIAIQCDEKGDISKSIYWFEKAAAAGDPFAQSNLAFRYSEGKGVYKNQTKAVELWKKSANQGNDVAQFALYNYYFDLGANGYSAYADSNIREAMRWLRKACDQNFEPAMNVFNNILNMAKGYDYQQRNLAIQLLRWMGLDV